MWSKEKTLIIAFIDRLDYTSNLGEADKGIVVRLRVRSKLGWGGSVWGKVLSSILVLAILGALGALIYTIAKSQRRG